MQGRAWDRRKSEKEEVYSVLKKRGGGCQSCVCEVVQKYEAIKERVYSMLQPSGFFTF